MILASARLNELELMDGDSFDYDEYETTLRQLELINHLTRGYRPTKLAIKQVARENPGRTIRVLDVGFGYGDTLRQLRKWSRRNKIDLDLTGIDLNPLSERIARKVTPEDMNIRYLTGDVFEYKGERFDVIINSLFMHHLRDDQIPQILKWMTDRAEVAWFINDLHRHPVAYYLIKYSTRLFGFNRLICHDAPLSVARSFRSADWRKYLVQAGIGDPQKVDNGVRISWFTSFRYGVFCDAKRARAMEAKNDSQQRTRRELEV